MYWYEMGMNEHVVEDIHQNLAVLKLQQLLRASVSSLVPLELKHNGTGSNSSKEEYRQGLNDDFVPKNGIYSSCWIFFSFQTCLRVDTNFKILKIQ